MPNVLIQYLSYLNKGTNIMSRTINLKTFVPALSAVVATSALLITPLKAAEENPFQITDLSSGYMVADGHGKHNKMKKMDTDGDGVVSKDEFMAHAEMKFGKKDKNGDGVISADEMKRKKKDGEGKCGEGKCGENKSDS